VTNLQFMVTVKLFCSFLQNLLFEFFIMLLRLVKIGLQDKYWFWQTYFSFLVHFVLF
jgi:hypothetical protein